MAKRTVVKFIREDAPKPKRNPVGTIGLRSPIPITVKVGSSVHLNFGISCNHPLLVVGGLLKTENVIFYPNQKIECFLKNPSSEDIIVEIGDSVLTVVPVLAPDFDLE